MKYEVQKPGPKHTCEKCKQVIEKSSYVPFGDKFWHTEHFVCHQCQANISNCPFYDHHDQILCQKCFTEKQCQKCENCGEYCVTESVKVANRAYHKACFKCHKCSKILKDGKFNFQDNRVSCVDCISSEMNLNCHTCSKQIRVDESYVMIGENQHHSECLKCYICHVPLGQMTKVVMVNQKPCCPNH
ncbi:LIM domain-binding protein 3 [Thelohanellus kitauei]|uniref:LIM domain-binding protein 3 n=1 Tax=Thelohanellus kitauei TaxID=669202 RepID=A0A0C2MMU9_THEKT|nr:LIM domain-binding protein 3 [Thelohanellus kitauei]